jgi:glucose/arabinose dehydrogenase
MRLFTVTSLAILGLAGSLLVGHANAQSAQPAPTTSPSAIAPADLSDQKIDAVATALEKVTKVDQDYSQQIAQAPSSDRERIVEEANKVMVKAVTDQGLSVEEYSKIIEVASNDAGLRQKILQRIPSARQ